ncbi:MAG TPA: hypothetical protein VJ323_07830, partial [Bryobacteraceae bacterium]|nr:hypothetical protein [Bryobacteraceae bacterium]
GWHERGREMYLAQESNLQAAAAIRPAHPARKRVRPATLEQGLFTFLTKYSGRNVWPFGKNSLRFD